MARRLLHDDGLDAADRVAGALVVIYAQPVTRIARLTTNDVFERDGDVFVRFGEEMVLMPPPLRELVLALPHRRQVGSAESFGATPTGCSPVGRRDIISIPNTSARDLPASGSAVDPVATRRFIQLARDLPAAVLADMLHIHRNTATRWVETAGGNWTNYAAARSQGATGREEVEA